MLSDFFQNCQHRKNDKGNKLMCFIVSLTSNPHVHGFSDKRESFLNIYPSYCPLMFIVFE